MPLREVPAPAVELIKSFEGIPDGDPTTVNLDPYLDPVGIWTIGWGHAIMQGGAYLRGRENRAAARALFPGGLTRVQAEALLRGDLVESARDVQLMAKVPLDDGQFGALVSFAFNLGSGALRNSTLLKLLNARNPAGAAAEFPKWCKGTDPKTGAKVTLPGLLKRRNAERAMFLGQPWQGP